MKSNDEVVEILTIVDMSGSMDIVRDDTIGGVNTLLADQKALGGNANLTLVLFDDRYLVPIKDVPIQDVQPLDRDTYRPMGWTAMNDAIGKALIISEMTTDMTYSWDDIDLTVFVDDDGQPYMFWGNGSCKWVKLKKNMIEMDGPMVTLDLKEFTEAPWIHKRKDWYYLSYASQFPEKIVYAMSKKVTGPWEYKGILNEIAGNSNTSHQAIIDFKGKSYFIYHNGGINTDGGSFRRSVCIDYLYYNKDGTMKRVVMTTEGVARVKK